MEFKWIRLGLAAKWDKAVQPALRLATVQVDFFSFLMVLMIINAIVKVYLFIFLRSSYQDQSDHIVSP